MTDVAYAYTKLRRDFGRQPMFCEFGPEMCDSISFDVGEAKNYILRNPVCQISQNTAPQSANEINTIRPEFSTTGMNHAEGGWPKDVNCLDPEATQRYRRKIEKDDNYIHCVASTAPQLLKLMTILTNTGPISVSYYVSNLVYATEVRSRDHLIEKIEHAFQVMKEEMQLKTTTVEIRKRYRACIGQNGHQFEQLL